MSKTQLVVKVTQMQSLPAKVSTLEFRPSGQCTFGMLMELESLLNRIAGDNAGFEVDLEREREGEA
jgi:hypothetical protein